MSTRQVDARELIQQLIRSSSAYNWGEMTMTGQCQYHSAVHNWGEMTMTPRQVNQQCTTVHNWGEMTMTGRRHGQVCSWCL